MKGCYKFILAAVVLVVLGGLLLLLPPVQERVFWRIDQARLWVFYTLNPPDADVFTPDSQASPDAVVAAAVQATLTQAAGLVTPTLEPSPTFTYTPLPPDAPTPTPTATPVPLPPSALIDNVPYVDQHYGFNNCAPATLAMMLQFNGWPGTRENISSAVKPFDRDKNVMPYELVDFTLAQPDLRAVTRVGGTDELLKRMVSNGYPVMVERGVYLRDLTGKISWMGHYQIVYGYDDEKQTWNVKDAFEDNGSAFIISYDNLTQGWRSFNYAFLLVYSPAQEAEVMALLGEYADDTAANQIAARIASDEIFSTTDQDKFFALFNRGSSLVRMQDYAGAALIYDQAFQLYAELERENRPWRMMWYQTGPYYAYYWTGRYYDVLNLADQTINGASEPYLEESFYWRARAKAALGDSSGAVEDLRKSLDYHPYFGPSMAMMTELGAAP